MKKILPIILFICLISALITTSFIATKIKKENKDIKNNIDIINKNTNTIKEEIQFKNDEIANKKESLKEELEELEVWEKTKEKINQALSS